MIAFLSAKENRDDFKLYLLNLTILLYLFRTAVPFFKYPFFLVYFSLILYSFLRSRGQIIQAIKSFISDYKILIILAIILVCSFFFSTKIYLIIFKDIINAIILLSIFFFLNFYIKTEKNLQALITNLIKLIIVLATLIAVIKLGELLSIFSGNIGDPVSNRSNILNNRYMDQDYNFGILPVIFGIIGVTYLWLNTNSGSKKIFFELIMTFFSVAIFFSGSRRGVIILLAFIALLIISQLIKPYLKNMISVHRSLRLIVFIFLTFLILMCLTLFTSYSLKNKVLFSVGSKNIAIAKENVATVLFKYNMILDNNKTYLDLFNTIWNVVPNDPESGWGTHNHKTIFPLSGKNVEIVPQNSMGYQMDRSCDATIKNGNAYSFTHIASKNVSEGDSVKASVFCYVSEDFDGEWACLSSEGSTHGELAKFYDLERKGSWQKLNLEVSCSEGNAAFFLYFAKYNANDFSSLKGYVIFAYPQVLVLKTDNSLSGIYYDRKSFIEHFNFKYPLTNTESELNRQHTSVNSFGIDPVLFHTHKIGLASSDESFQLKYVALNINRLKTTQSNYLPLELMESSGSDQDPVRTWVSRFISEDTAYYPLKNKIFVDASYNKFGDERFMRWIFAVKVYSKEFNWKQKIFGGGFNFLNWYGYYFLNDKTKSDWPHNPFLSILLYSGILGLSLYCFFIYKVFYYYVKYIKEYPLLFIFFLITFFFSFFSGGSPFDPPIMGFFVILPFFIHSVYKRELSEFSKVINI